MHVVPLRDGDEDRLESFLAGHAQSSMFLRSNLRDSGLTFADKAYHGDYLATLSDAGRVTGVVAHYWNGNVMVQAPDQTSRDLLAEALRRRAQRSIAGFQGPTEQVDHLLDTLGFSAAQFSMFADNGLYALGREALVKPAHVTDQHIEMISAARTDRETLLRWLTDYEIEALGRDHGETHEAEVSKRVQRLIERNDCWVLHVDGHPVALSAFNARLADTVQVGPVWTPPEHRCKSYARTIVAMTLEHVFAGSVVCALLFTDNPAAVKAYKAIGFVRCGSYRLALLRKPHVF